MLQRHLLLARVRVGDALVGEEVEHRRVRAAQKPFAGRDARQHADHALGRGVDAVLHARLERGVVDLGDGFAAAHDEQAVHLRVGAVLHDCRERAGIHAHLFRLGALPLGVRPRGRARLREHGRAQRYE
jgi:hypothetical protein